MIRAFILLLVVVLSTSAVLAQTQFATGRYRLPPIVTSVYDVVSGDIDGDGFIDLVLGNDYAPNTILLNDRLGSFRDATAGRLPTPPAKATYQVDLEDVDGDGDLDLVTCNDHYLSNRLYLNNGIGFFTDVTATRLPPNGDYTESQVVVDVDGDGDLDIVFGNLGQDRLYLNNGSGTFADATAANLPASGRRTRYLAAGDLDGDGDPDLLLTDGSTLSVLLNSGSGVFANAAAGFLPVTNGSLPEIADVNGDGRPDVLLDGGRKLLLAQPTGGFSDVTATHLPTSVPGHTGETADVDLDGDLDLLGGSLVFLNDGTGRFVDVSSARILPRQPTRLGVQAIGDFDGDGDPDLCLPRFMSSAHLLLMNFDRQLDAPAPPAVGSPYTLDLWARPGYSAGPHVAIPAWAFGRALMPIPGVGILGLSPLGLGTMPLAAIPQTGRLRIPIPIPNDPSFAGLQVHFQALILDPAQPVQLSNVVSETVQ